MRLIVAAAQSAAIAGDIAANVENHLRFATVAAEHGAQLLIFPELSLTGYELAIARSHVTGPDSAALDPLRRFAAEAHMTIVAGAPLRSERDELYIGALAMRPDGSVSTYAKEHVHESETHVFTSGPGGAVLRVADATVALAICADVGHPQHAAKAAARGADIYAVGALFDQETYTRKARLLESCAREHGMAVLLANYSGRSGEYQSAGKSSLWSEEGKVVASIDGAEEAILIGKLENGLWEAMVVPQVAGIRA